jgi:hypothetical protein
MSLPTRSRSRSPVLPVPSSSKTRRSPVATRSKTKSKVGAASLDRQQSFEIDQVVIDISQFASNSPEVKAEPRKRGRPPKIKAQTATIECEKEEVKVQPLKGPPGGLGKGSLPDGFMNDQEYE